MNSIAPTVRLTLFGLLLTIAIVARSHAEPVEVKVTKFYHPNMPDDPSTKRLIESMREDPEVRIAEWGRLSLPGGAGRSPIMMAIAGKTAPDIMESWFHIIGNDTRQGFLYPLNEWVGDDTNGNDQIDDSEAKWGGWKKIPPLWRQVATDHGKVYGIPQPMKYYLGVIYRIDMVSAAGLDPGHPPETWDELIYWCEKLADPGKEIPGALIKRGQRGICLFTPGFTWIPWMQSAGADPIVQVRISPKTGREYEFSPDLLHCVTPEGENLSKVEPTYRANFAAPGGVAAAELLHRFMWQKWLRDAQTGEPVNLTAEDLKNHSVMVGEHKNEFTDNDVITGMARADLGQRGADVWQLLNRGEVAMLTWFAQDLSSVGSAAGIDPNMVSWCPFPAGPGGKRVVQVQQHYAVMCEAVRDRPKNERDKVWETLTALCEQRVFDDIVRRKVLTGEARFVNPQDLTRLGFGDYLKDVPDAIRQNYREIDSGKVATYTEPFMGFWATMDEAISREMVSLVLAETGENFDYAAALRKVQNDANSGKMFQRSKQELNRYRPTARIVIAIMAIVFCVFMVLIIRSYTIHRGGTIQQVYRGWLPWAMAAPALILIGLWGYYPLMRGSVMAFQDYKIAGASAFVGLDNFITLALDRSFWTSMARTVYFVLLNVTFAFLAPIILAILLSEIKRAKIFYRTLFFLPQVTSAIVIALLWKLMYDPTPFGLFNQLFGLLNYLPFVHFEPKTWLQDPKLAMVCCVIPTVWASMGMSSLIYLAALRAFPRTATKPTTWTARECGRSWGGSRCRRCSR